jgi:SMI1/KNR4 family protein SUKH-1
VLHGASNYPQGRDWHNYRRYLASLRPRPAPFLAPLAPTRLTAPVSREHAGSTVNETNDDEPRWRSLLGRIRALQMELKRVLPERRVGLAGNPGAPDSAIAVAELRLGRKLPPSYRQFLAFSDGWPDFFENACLLGTGEIGRQPAPPRQSGTSSPPSNRRAPSDSWVPFGVDRNGVTLFAFDTSASSKDGELPVVAWLGGLGLNCTCFTAFLATVLQLCRAELVSAKAQGMRSAGNRLVKAG